MYILVNNKPINIFNIDIYDVVELDEKLCRTLYENANQAHNRNRVGLVMYGIATRNNWIKVEFQHEDVRPYPYDSDEKDYLVLKNGFLFGICDSQRVVISKLYETREEAEEARNMLLFKINKVVARLMKAEI